VSPPEAVLGDANVREACGLTHLNYGRELWATRL
jgi:hypothetical protein